MRKIILFALWQSFVLVILGSPQSQMLYSVQPNDNLTEILKKFNMTEKQLTELNPGLFTDAIFPGLQIKVLKEVEIKKQNELQPKMNTEVRAKTENEIHIESKLISNSIETNVKEIKTEASPLFSEEMIQQPIKKSKHIEAELKDFNTSSYNLDEIVEVPTKNGVVKVPLRNINYLNGGKGKIKLVGAKERKNELENIASRDENVTVLDLNNMGNHPIVSAKDELVIQNTSFTPVKYSSSHNYNSEQATGSSNIWDILSKLMDNSKDKNVSSVSYNFEVVLKDGTVINVKK